MFSPDWTTSTGPGIVRARRHDGKLIESRRQPDGSYLPADADITRQLLRLVDASGNNTAWKVIDTVDNVVETYSGMQAGLPMQGKLVSLNDHRTDVTAYLLDTANKPSDAYHSITGYGASGYKLHFAYDAQGRAYQSRHGAGADLTSLAYGANSTTVTNALGTARTYDLTTVLGVVRVAGASQPGGSGCGPASSASTYDANGNAASRKDFNGNQVCYDYDPTRNLETRRVEALPSSAVCATALTTPPAPTAAKSG